MTIKSTNQNTETTEPGSCPPVILKVLLSRLVVEFEGFAGSIQLYSVVLFGHGHERMNESGGWMGEQENA
ncbi:MAG: hypothetical protein GY775_15375 [Candidatus Scalindua sp.]|nr:hypothetical protein [Candidatus Scalindua sp.]